MVSDLNIKSSTVHKQIWTGLTRESGSFLLLTNQSLKRTDIIVLCLLSYKIYFNFILSPNFTLKITFTRKLHLIGAFLTSINDKRFLSITKRLEEMKDSWCNYVFIFNSWPMNTNDLEWYWLLRIWVVGMFGCWVTRPLIKGS